jgi:hypothetical protein
MSDDEIYAIQEKLNNCPGKRLNWLTPNEYYTMLIDPNFTISRLFYSVVAFILEFALLK